MHSIISVATLLLAALGAIAAPTRRQATADTRVRVILRIQRSATGSPVHQLDGGRAGVRTFSFPADTRLCGAHVSMI